MTTRTFWIVATLIACVCVSVSANPIILAPSGTTLSTGQVRAEAAFSSDSEHGKYFWLGTGLMQVEANVIRADDVNGRTENQVGVQWNFLPETFATPAVAFGGTDVSSQSKDGIGVYVVATKQLKVARYLPMVESFSGTFGIGAAGIRGPFFGAQVKLPYGFFMEGEYDSRDFNGAVGWQPMKLLKLKAYSIHSDFYVGAEIPPISF
jgi:hypothetical protein